MNDLVTVSHENTEDILLQFINYDSSSDATTQFESTMSTIISKSVEDDDYDDFL